MYAPHDARHHKYQVGIKYASNGIFTLCHCSNIDVPFLIDCVCSLICIYCERQHVLLSFVGDYWRIDYVFACVDNTMPYIVFLLTLSHLFFIMQLNTPPFTSRSNLDIGSPSYTMHFAHDHRRHCTTSSLSLPFYTLFLVRYQKPQNAARYTLVPLNTKWWALLCECVFLNCSYTPLIFLYRLWEEHRWCFDFVFTHIWTMLSIDHNNKLFFNNLSL
mgnify:CR=1 FL=1